jgi:hypothetical protein
VGPRKMDRIAFCSSLLASYRWPMVAFYVVICLNFMDRMPSGLCHDMIYSKVGFAVLAIFDYSQM